MKTLHQIIVPALDSSWRLNTYCEHKISFFQSRKSVKKAIKKGEVLLNDQPAHGGTWLKEGDKISIIDLELTPPKPYHLTLEIIFEDDYLAIVNKPAGLTVSGNQFKTLANALSYNLSESPEADKLPWPLPVHRLDNPTSGLIIIAKTKSARIKLGQQFEHQSIEKTYYAIVMGKLEGKGILSTPVQTKPATTIFESEHSVRSLKNDWLTLVKLSPKTGRTHQLRVQLAEQGTPILGDQIYAKGITLKHKGLFLSAVALSLLHPITSTPLEISIPIPEKFNRRLTNEARRWLTYHA